MSLVKDGGRCGLNSEMTFATVRWVGVEAGDRMKPMGLITDLECWDEEMPLPGRGQEGTERRRP